MTCAEIKDRTIDFLYGELPAGERTAFEQHLAGCDACRGEVLGLQGTLHQARAAVKLTDEAPPPRVRVAVLEAARAAAGPAIQMAARTASARKPIEERAEGGGLWDWLRRPWLIPLAAAAAVVTIFVVGKDELTKSTPYDVARPEPAAEAPKSVTAPVVTPRPSMPATPPPVAEAPPASAKPPSPPRKASASHRREAASNEKRDGLDLRSGSRAYAPPPPPRPALRQAQPQEEAEGDTLEGGSLSGAVGGLEERKGAAPGGAGAGYLGLGGGRKNEAPADKAPAQIQRGPAPRELAKPAPVRAQAPASTASAAPSPAAPAPRQAPAAEKEASRASRGRAAEPAAASLDDVMDERAAPAKAKKAGEAQQLAVQERIDRADRLFTANRWAEAAAAYRELVRLYPDHKSVNLWKERLRTCEQAQRPQSR